MKKARFIFVASIVALSIFTYKGKPDEDSTTKKSQVERSEQPTGSAVQQIKFGKSRI